MMILPNPSDYEARTRFGPHPALHPIWIFGYFGNRGQVVVGPWVEKSEVVYISDYPHTSWAAAKAIFRAYLREVGE